MLSLIVYMVVTILIGGLFIWAIEEMPWFPSDAKKMVRIIVTVAAVLWMINLIFPGHFPR